MPTTLTTYVTAPASTIQSTTHVPVAADYIPVSNPAEIMQWINEVKSIGGGVDPVLFPQQKAQIEASLWWKRTDTAAGFEHLGALVQVTKKIVLPNNAFRNKTDGKVSRRADPATLLRVVGWAISLKDDGSFVNYQLEMKAMEGLFYKDPLTGSLITNLATSQLFEELSGWFMTRVAGAVPTFGPLTKLNSLALPF